MEISMANGGTINPGPGGCDFCDETGVQLYKDDAEIFGMVISSGISQKNLVGSDRLLKHINPNMCKDWCSYLCRNRRYSFYLIR